MNKCQCGRFFDEAEPVKIEGWESNPKEGLDTSALKFGAYQCPCGRLWPISMDEGSELYVDPTVFWLQGPRLFDRNEYVKRMAEDCRRVAEGMGVETESPVVGLVRRRMKR
jgi:hypothetical protein